MPAMDKAQLTHMVYCSEPIIDRTLLLRRWPLSKVKATATV